MDADPDSLVTVYETRSRPRAAIVQIAFADHDIPFSILNDMMSTIYPVDGMAVIGIQVRARDAERAAAVLQEMGLD
ncbi:MAG: DUF2007 domain-containing protein [Candidatus Brocadiia bacterium]